ncbi:MAG: STAS domain-containing protein [Thermoanaerobaculia bacterium]
MNITDERRGDVLVVRPEGRIDTNTSDELDRALVGRIDGGARRLVIDMGGTDYISSAGLRVLLLAAKKLKGVSGQLVLGAMNPSVRQIFELAGFVAIFAIEPDVDRAVARAAA